MNSIVVWSVVSAALMTSVGGHPDVGSLTLKIPRKVDDTDRICSALAGDKVFSYIFPWFGGFEIDTDGSDARKTMKNTYDTFAALDREFTVELEEYVHTVMKTYNVLALKYMSIDPSMDDVQIYHDAFSVFGFLDVSNATVKKDFDNAILYAYVELEKPLLVERVSRYDRDENLNGKTNNETIILFNVLKDNLRKLSDVFVHRFRLAWLNVYEFGRMSMDIAFPELTENMESYYEDLMNEMKCKIWDDYDFGFLTHTRTSVLSGSDSSRKKARHGDPSSSGPELGTMSRMKLLEISEWMINRMNLANMLVYNNVHAELLMYTVASISSPLYNGAVHFLHAYCVGLDEHGWESGVRDVGYLRTYLMQFNRLYGKIGDAIRKYLNVDVTGMDRFEPLTRNLSVMIKLTSVSDHVGDSDADRMRSMERAVETEYGPSTSASYYYIDNRMDAKRTYLMPPIILLHEFLNLYKVIGERRFQDLDEL